MDKGIQIANECSITYKTPGETCRSAMPIGNGELAASVWTNKAGNLEIYLSRSDALSEIDRTLKLGKISVKMTPNPFMGDAFEQTLDLAAGSIVVSGEQGFCRVFIGEQTDSLFIYGKFTTKVQVEVTYDTWRTEEFYYENEFSKEDIPESADVVQQLPEGIYFYHKNSRTIIEETLKNQRLEECRDLVPDFLTNRIFGGIVEGLSDSFVEDLEIRIHTRSAQESEEVFRKQLLSECKKNDDIQQEYRKVKERWNLFWARSYIRVTGDETKTVQILPETAACATEPSSFICESRSAVTRAYTLTKYMMACCSGGNFPMLYNGLLFQQEPAAGMHFQMRSFGKSYTGQPGKLSLESNPDERSWAREQLWQNLRHLYLVLPAMGEADKLKTLFDYFRNFQEINRVRAKKYYGAKGQHNTEMTLSFGLQNIGIYGRDRTDKAIGWAENRWGGAVDISPGLELVNLMLDYYDHTQDEEFLKELLAYAKELLLYIETRFPNRQEGKIVMGPLQSIETYWNTINPITVVAGMHAIVHRIVSLSEGLVKEHKYFSEYQRKLPDIPVGKEAEEWILKPAMAYAKERHNVEPPEYYTIFPFNLVDLGILEKETALHTFLVRTKECDLYRPFVLGSAPDVPSYCGWQYLGVVAAKLGLTDMCKEIITYNCSVYNPGYRFPAMWGPIYDAVPDADHGANILHLLQQMILQTTGEKISVLPAFPAEWTVEYRLFVNQDTVIEGDEKGYEIKKSERRKAMGKFREELQSPPNEYRSKPFWAWNEWMKPTKIRQQMDQMKEQHMGGCFIHSREGLETEYLSQEWMECVEETVSYGKEKALDIWIYDEDKWPSGMAGGMVVKEHPQCRAKALTLQINPDGTHTYQIESTKDSDWYNGFGPADNLDSCSVQFFLKQTHEEYEKALSGFEDVKGFFTDEPNVCDFFAHFTKGRAWLPWSEQFEAFFERKRGYQIQEHLDALFFDIIDAPKIRNDYCKTITELFSDSYFRQISEWLHSRNMQFTGHLLFENDLGYNSRTSGAIMPHYRFFDIPGIDILGEQDNELLTVKQCTSVAHQFGKEHVMSETYGCTKWDFGLEGQKWLGDWQFIQGVTMRCQHLFMYSIKGLRKRDYPPVFSPQTTWWKHSHILEDYFARFSVCSTYGEVNREILVLHPQSSAWLHAGSRADEDLSNWDDNMGWLDEHFRKGNQIGADFQRIIKALLASHRDCDLGDEMLMEEYGRVENKVLYVGAAGYNTVLIPPIENIFASTIQLLSEFMERGGTVIAAGEPPEYVDGERSCQGKKLYQNPKLHRFSTAYEAINYIRSSPNAIHITKETGFEDEDILTMYRIIPEGKMLICSNHDRQKAHEIQISMEGKGRIERIDLAEGISSFLPAQYEVRTNQMVFMEKLGAVETAVYILHEGTTGEEKAPDFSYKHPHAAKNIAAGVDIKASVTRELPNVLPLDCCCYRYQNITSPKMPLWQAQKEIRERLDMCPNWYNGAPQRYTWNQETHKQDGSYLELEYHFVVADEAVHNIELAAEELQRFDVMCNGEKIYTRGETLPEDAFFLDCAMKRVSIAGDCLKQGENQLIFQIYYEQDMELEDIYLLGDFAVNQKRELVKEDNTLLLGDWCLQGYPHYVGGMTYHFSLEVTAEQKDGAHLYLQEWKAAAADIFVNGQFVKTIGWKGQDGVDIASYLETGNNQIDIKLTASPRNLFGPFHQKYEACIRSSFKDFRTEGKEYTKEYLVQPQGLLKPVVIMSNE